MEKGSKFMWDHKKKKKGKEEGYGEKLECGGHTHKQKTTTKKNPWKCKQETEGCYREEHMYTTW